MSSAEKGKSRVDSAEAPVGEIPSEGPHAPLQNTQEEPSVTIPAVAIDMLEKSCLVRDLRHLSMQGLHVVMDEFASCWAKVREYPLCCFVFCLTCL